MHMINLRRKTFIISLLFLISLLLPATITNAAATVINPVDDPGYGRLSGTDIPKEFYEDGRTGLSKNGLSFTPFNIYGSFQTTSTYTNATYTHQDRFDGMTITNGIDVSQFQGDNINWSEVKASGIDFAFIRACGRGYGSSGKLYNDSYYEKNISGATAAGINVGIYIYSQATTKEEAIEEAQFLLGRAAGHTINLPLVLDYEFASPKDSKLRAANLTKEAATEVCLAFCETIQAAGYTPMVYANPDMLNNHLNADVISGSYPIWLANYTTATTYPGVFSYWQYSEKGTVPGISTSVDMDFYYVAPIADISNAIINPIPDQTYTGSEIKPALTITLNGTALTEGTHYTVSYSDNIAPGKASATITGTNGYTGTRVVPFNIIDGTPIPDITDLALSKKTKNSLTLSWTAADNIDGYELYRSTSPNGEYSLTAQINAGKTSFNNTKLTEGQAYYYKIRGYRKAGDAFSYGNFSGPLGTYTKTSYTRLALPKAGTDIYLDTDINSEVVASAAKNAFVKVTYCTYDDAGTKWYRVSYSDNVGFIPVSNVTTAKQGKVKTTKVNVRKKASTTSKKLTTIGKNKKVAIIKTSNKKSGKWYKVIFKKGSKTYKAWIYSIYIKI